MKDIQCFNNETTFNNSIPLIILSKADTIAEKICEFKLYKH